MNYVLGWLLAFSFMSSLYAEESSQGTGGQEESLKDKAKRYLDQATDLADETYDDYKKSKTSREIRAEKKMGVSIAPLTPGIYLPTKRSYNADYNFNEDHNLGLEYISGTLGLKLSKIQIAELKESLLLIPYRYYFGSNSFYLKAGLGRRKYTVVLGDSILETVADAFGSDILPHIKSLDIRSYILLLGLGNQWQHDSGFYLGVDWLELFVPIGGVKTNEKITPYLQGKDKDNMDKIIKVMESVPSLNVLKVKLGWSF